MFEKAPLAQLTPVARCSMDERVSLHRDADGLNIQPSAHLDEARCVSDGNNYDMFTLSSPQTLDVITITDIKFDSQILIRIFPHVVRVFFISDCKIILESCVYIGRTRLVRKT